MNKHWKILLGIILVAIGTYGVMCNTHPTSKISSVLTLVWGCYFTFKGCK